VTCGFVDQAAPDGSSEDRSAVEVGSGEVTAVVSAVGHTLGDTRVRPGRVVVHPAGVPPQYRVFMPEHQQLSILRQVAAKH